MYVIEILISGLVGAALGYIFNELVDSFKKKRRKRKYDKRNTNLSEELKKGVYTVDENGIITLAHGTPSYCPGLIKGFITDKMFITQFQQPIPLMKNYQSLGLIKIAVSTKILSIQKKSIA